MDIYVTEYILEAQVPVFWKSPSRKNVRPVRHNAQTSAKRSKQAQKLSAVRRRGVLHGQNAKQLSRMTRFGMTSQAIQSATMTAAEVMGWGYEVGKIEAGYAADFVAVKGVHLRTSSYSRSLQR